jgi:hypothetical protein
MKTALIVIGILVVLSLLELVGVLLWLLLKAYADPDSDEE